MGVSEMSPQGKNIAPTNFDKIIKNQVYFKAFLHRKI